MSALVWLADPAGGARRRRAWASWAARPRGPADPLDSVAAHHRFVEALERSRQARPPDGPLTARDRLRAPPYTLPKLRAMSRRVLTLITGAVLLLALLVGGSQLPVPYAELGPGPTLDTLGVDQSGHQIIQLTGGSRQKTAGHLNLTTVSVRDRLDLLGALRGWLDPERAVVPREEIFPPGPDPAADRPEEHPGLRDLAELGRARRAGPPGS